MTNSLPPDLAAFVQASVASGAYESTEAVVVAGIRLLQERADYDAYLRRELQKGLDAIERGEYDEFNSDGEIDFFVEEQLRACHERWVSQRKVS